MEASSDEDENRKSLIEEALKILNEEGFRLPGDVVDTLQTASRSSARPRGRGSLRGHRMCEVQSSNRKMRNVRESSARRSQSRSDDEGRSARANDKRFSDSDSDAENVGTRGTTSDDVFVDKDADTTTAPVRPNPHTTNVNTTKDEVEVGACGIDDPDKDAMSESSSISTASASTVRKVNPIQDTRVNPQLQRQDSGSSVASSASALNRKLAGLDRRHSSTSDTGYSTSIENALQTHEARAENLKNINKHTENLMSQRLNNGLRREISHDSGFTEPGYQQGLSQCSTPTPSDLNKATNQEFHDISKTKTDVTEKFMSTPGGDAHVVTSCSSDLAATEMTSRNNDMTDDGTAVSTASKLSHQETGSENCRVTTKATGNQISKEEDYEVENRTTNSSRNDSIATSIDDVTTASSRHAASMEQNLHLEKSRLATSLDGKSLEASMAVDEQLSRQQEMNNVERSSDGSSKDEKKKVSEKSSISKSHREHKVNDDDTEASLSSSQHLEGRARQSNTDENLVGTDGSKVQRQSGNATSSFAEQNTTEQRKVTKDPSGINTSEELVKKSDKSSNVESSFSLNEVKVSPTGNRSEVSKSEDSKALSSSFSGQCESTEVKDGVQLHRTVSSEKSSENTSKSSKSFSSFSNTPTKAINDGITSRERRPSTDSAASTLTNYSGLSRENIRPPSYEETMSNRSSRRNSGDHSSVYSRQDSCASSIASSAGAENERQRQKQLARERGTSDNNIDVSRLQDSTSKRKVHDYLRQNSNSSDSTLSGGAAAYRKDSFGSVDDDLPLTNSRRRIIDHPIRQTGQSAYNRSKTDSVCDRPKNRRATLDDVVLTERELRQAREEVRSQVRGMDDTYVSKPRATRSNRSTSSSAFDRAFDRSFEDDVFDMVDRFFKRDDDDDDFGFTSLRTRRRPQTRPTETPSAGRQKSYGKERHQTYDIPVSRASRNPYVTREDLSQLSREEMLDSLTSNRNSSRDYAASDYSYPSLDRKSYGTSSRDILDTASDSGGFTRSRYSNNRDRDTVTTGVSSLHPQTQYHHTDDNHYRFPDASSRLANSTNDISRRAGKSINSSRDEMNTSITSASRRSEQDKHKLTDYSSSGYLNDSNSYGGYKPKSHRLYNANECDADAMSDANSTCYSLPPEVLREGRENGDSRLQDMKSQSLPDVSQPEGQNGDIATDPENSRRKRIDKALTWIRSELTGLRTQDKVLMSQFQRCQDSIEQLKRQRPWYEVFSDEEEEEGEEGEDETHWEDWEIEDFDRSDMRENGEGSGATTTKDYKRYSSTSSSSKS